MQEQADVYSGYCTSVQALIALLLLQYPQGLSELYTAAHPGVLLLGARMLGLILVVESVVGGRAILKPMHHESTSRHHHENITVTRASSLATCIAPR